MKRWVLSAATQASTNEYKLTKNSTQRGGVFSGGEKERGFSNRRKPILRRVAKGSGKGQRLSLHEAYDEFPTPLVAL